MEKITYDQQQLMSIYNAGTRTGTITALEEMRPHLEADETELRDLTDSVISVLNAMTDEDFDKLDLTPDFGGEDDAG